MEQILLAYGLLKETVTAIMMLHKNTKAIVHARDGDTEFFGIVTGVLFGIVTGVLVGIVTGVLFNIVTGVLQEEILASYLFIICLSNILRTSIDLIRMALH